MSLPLIEELGKLAYRQHFWVDGDNWYSCPKAPDGCADDQWPQGVCNCGADEHNAKVEALLAKLRELHHQDCVSVSEKDAFFQTKTELHPKDTPKG